MSRVIQLIDDFFDWFMENLVLPVGKIFLILLFISIPVLFFAKILEHFSH